MAKKPLTEQEMMKDLCNIDTPTITNVVATYPGDPLCLSIYNPWTMNWYTDNTLRCWYPELGAICGFAVTASATVIQAHAVAMFAPGFFTGRLIGRFGVRRVIVAGVLLNVACVLVALLGESFGHFTLALVALGLGWNFMFTGATAMLGESHRPEERVRAQTANDFIVFGTVACTALGSGVLHAGAGWNVLNLAVLPTLAVALLLVLWPRKQALQAV